ncbi:hypothetical protein HKX48_009143 [Thoreauomyces humboldtii]|nr:hypothetical protein HKX48_009143 [Thoreauomyces humboldtii]
MDGMAPDLWDDFILMGFVRLLEFVRETVATLTTSEYREVEDVSLFEIAGLVEKAEGLLEGWESLTASVAQPSKIRLVTLRSRNLPRTLPSEQQFNMQHLERTHYDAIILGTGVVESIVAGSLARAGKSVLHVDRNEFYGDHLAAFDLITFLKTLTHRDPGTDSFSDYYDAVEIIADYAAPTAEEILAGPVEDARGESQSLQTTEDVASSDDATTKPKEAGLEESTNTEADESAARGAASDSAEVTTFLQDYPHMRTLFEGESTFLIPPTSALTGVPMSPSAKAARNSHLLQLLRKARQFSIELSPKLLYGRGPLVELLVTSGVGKYLEFKVLEQIYLSWNGELELVPGSKEDVFSNSTVSLVDKRRLMKFLTFALDYETNESVYEPYKGQPYIDFLREQKLNPRLCAFVVNATALAVESELAATLSTERGLELTQRHLRSIGRWGKTAFLVALYGAGSELAQSFCRLSAVYGGTYILNYSVKEIKLPNGIGNGEAAPVTVVGTDGQTYTAACLISSSSYAKCLSRSGQPKLRSKSVWRGVAVLDRPVYAASCLNITVFPPESINNAQGVTALHQSVDVSACPKDYYIVHLLATGAAATKEDVRKALLSLVSHGSTPRPKVVLAALYRQTVEECGEEGGAAWVNDRAVFLTPAVGTVDLEDVVDVARGVFERVKTFGDGQGGEELEFLPKGEGDEEE